MNYGIPYMGSKNRLAKDIIKLLPSGETLIDLFGGGGAITHCAALSNKWNTIVYNELNKLVYDGFRGTLEGKYDDDNRWISKQEFDALKTKDFYVACCFSFGNCFYQYMYNPTTEKYKKAYHYAVIFNDWQYMEELFQSKWISTFQQRLQPLTTIKDKRIEMAHAIYDYIVTEEDNEVKRTINTVTAGQLLQNAECKQRLIEVRNSFNYGSKSNLLQHTQKTERLSEVGNSLNKGKRNLLQNAECKQRLIEVKIPTNNIEFYNLDYREVPIPDNAIVYCDIPYKNTGKYTVGEFDYDAFYQWCEDNKHRYKIYVSSYDLPTDKFKEVWSKEKQCSFSKEKYAGKHNTVEKIYVPL